MTKKKLKAPSVDDHRLRTTAIVRGNKNGPALFIHGVTPRSGTNYVGRLLALHPDFEAYPNQLWEFPFLSLAGDILALQKKFIQLYPTNAEKIGQNDFLTLFGSAAVAYLSAFVPKGKRALLKVPRVDYLDRFFFMFPREHLLILMRDGRDVVSSAMETWPDRKFSDLCKRWDTNARIVHSLLARNSKSRKNGWLVKYEDVIQDPGNFVREACQRFSLKENRYPFKKIEGLPVIGSSALKVRGKVVWSAIKKPSNFNPIGRWRKWPAREKAVFKKIAGKTLIRFGYGHDLGW